MVALQALQGFTTLYRCYLLTTLAEGHVGLWRETTFRLASEAELNQTNKKPKQEKKILKTSSRPRLLCKVVHQHNSDTMPEAWREGTNILFC